MTSGSSCGKSIYNLVLCSSAIFPSIIIISREFSQPINVNSTWSIPRLSKSKMFFLLNVTTDGRIQLSCTANFDRNSLQPLVVGFSFSRQTIMYNFSRFFSVIHMDARDHFKSSISITVVTAGNPALLFTAACNI